MAAPLPDANQPAACQRHNWECPDPQRPSQRSAHAHSVWCRPSVPLGSGEKGPTVPDNVVLIMRFHPVGGEDVSVISGDFTSEREAVEAIARALDKQRSLVLRHARYNREADENGVIVNLANVVSVRVSKTDSAATGQYL
jgi:hypothetical protein